MESLITIIFHAAKLANIPPALLLAVCSAESNLKPKAFVQHDGNSSSIGMCQVKKATSDMLGFVYTKKQLLEPKANTQVAATYLAYQLRRYKGNVCKTVASYNSGKYKASSRNAKIPFNYPYVLRVFSFMNPIYPNLKEDCDK